MSEKTSFIPTGGYPPIIRVEEKVSKIENNSMTFITNRIKGLKIALKVARAENKPKIQKRILGLEIAKKMQPKKMNNGGGVVSKENSIKEFFKKFGFNVEDIQKDEYSNGIEGWIVFYDNKNKYRVIDYSVAMYLIVHDKTTNKTDIIKQSKSFNIDNFKRGGGVDGIDWYKYDGQYEAEFGNFYLYVIPSNERGRYYVRVTDGYRGDIISESREEILGLDNAKELAIDIVGDYMKQFNNGGGVEIEVISMSRLLSTFSNEKEIFDGQIVNIGEFQYKIENDIFYIKRPNENWQMFRKIKYDEGGNKISKGAVVFTNYNGSEIMYEPNYDEYFVNDEVFDSMESAKRHIDYMAKSNGVIIDYYNGYDINIYPKLNEYWVNDEIKFNSMEDAKNYIDTGEMENDSYGFGGGLLVGSLVGGYLGYKVGKYNKQTFSTGFDTEKRIGKDIKNKLQGKKFVGGGSLDIDINKYFNYSQEEVEEMLDYTDYKDEILFTKIAESDNFTYYYVLNELISNKDKEEQKYFAVYKPSGRGGDFEILNGVSFVGGNSYMPLQDEIHYGKLNYQHPLLKQIMQQDSYYKNNNKFDNGGSVWEKNGFKQFPNSSPQEYQLVEWSFNGSNPSFKGRYYYQKGTGFMFIEKENGEIYKPISSNKLFWRKEKRYDEGGGVDTISDEDLLRIKLAVSEAENRIKANDTESNSGGGIEGITKFVKENPQVLALLEKGGSVGDENYEMLKNKVTELLHHSKELQAVVKKKPKTPAWVISKSSRASTDLSDITHYLEGKL